MNSIPSPEKRGEGICAVMCCWTFTSARRAGGFVDFGNTLEIPL